MTKKFILIFVVLFILLVTIFGFFIFNGRVKNIKEDIVESEKIPQKTFKILHIMSYHTPWYWTEDQFDGFKESLKDLNIEYKVYQMDTKRRSDEAWKLEAAKEAKNIIESWKPDLVYTTDDIAQKYVAKDYVNSSLPFVFSAVNADPSDYGFDNSKNITGVLEREHIYESIKLFKEINPGVKKIIAIIDDDPTWPKLIIRIKNIVSTQFPDLDFIALKPIFTFADYKKTILDYQKKADGIALLGIFTFKDEKGKNVPFEDVLKWTRENSILPDFSFWKDRIGCGTLAGVYVSGFEQGLSAGKLARKILVDNISPSNLPIMSSLKGKPAISLKRANSLGIKIDANILLSSLVFKNFECE